MKPGFVVMALTMIATMSLTVPTVIAVLTQIALSVLHLNNHATTTPIAALDSLAIQ